MDSVVVEYKIRIICDNNYVCILFMLFGLGFEGRKVSRDLKKICFFKMVCFWWCCEGFIFDFLVWVFILFVILRIVVSYLCR